VRDGARLWHQMDSAWRHMRDCSDDFLDFYLDTIGDQALEGPGAYRLEGLGAQLFTRIEGDYFTILGLPLLPLLDYLRVQGVIAK
jgi:septum formation protein